MPLRDTVRDAQRKLAELDSAHRRAAAKLDRATARRTAVLAEQDRLVQGAQNEVDRAIAAMALETGPELAATVLGLEVAHVRRLGKKGRQRQADGRGTLLISQRTGSDRSRSQQS
jgi:hypothetical protein